MFCKVTQDIDPHFYPVWRSKMPCSLIPAEAQKVKRYVIERLAQSKAILISYELWMSCKKGYIFSLTAHYCTGPNINTTHIEMPSTIGTDGVSLYKYVAGVVENFGSEANIVGITSASGVNAWVCREAME